MKGGDFSKKGTLEYFFKNLDEKPMCFICNTILSATKEYNIKRQYETNHSKFSYGKLHGDDRKQKVNQLQKQLNSRHFMFQNMGSDNEKVLKK